MPFISPMITLLGLAVFEIISSFDNAIINAEVLSTMKPVSRKWFVTWGLLISVFLVRGLLPFLIVFLLNPSKGLLKTFFLVFGNNPETAHSLERSAPYLLLAGGVFMIFVFFHWLFLEEKNFGLPGEKFIARQGVWFYAVVSLILAFIVWEAVHANAYFAFSAVIGSTVFFIIHGFKQQAEMAERNLLEKGMSDISKILYLEVIDMTFSIDGVLGSFAFTFEVLLILLGNGLGALVLRQVTVSNIERIKNYIYIKNGAMYSIFILGIIMLLESFSIRVPFWLSPLATIIIVGYFFSKSTRKLR